MSHQEDARIDRKIHAASNGSDPFAVAVRTTRMPMVITDPNQPDHPIVFVNDAFCQLTGYSRQETIGRNCRFLQGPATNSGAIERLRNAINDHEAIEIDLLNYRRDGTTFWNRLLISPVFDDGRLTYFAASQYDITPERDKMKSLAGNQLPPEMESQQRAMDLAASEDRLQFVLNAGGFGTWSLDVPSKRLATSAICKANFGRNPTDTFTYQDMLDVIHPDDFPRWKKELHRALDGNGEFNIEYRVIGPDSQVHWVEIRSQTRMDPDGTPLTMTGVSMDVTQRQVGEAHRQLLVQELGHRIKNTLATVQSIVSQTIRSGEYPSELTDVLNRRIEALGGAHDVLTGHSLDHATLVETVARALKPFTGEGGRIKIIGGETAEMSGRASQALTMALHELATNAVKYGALSNATGSIAVDWQFEDQVFMFTWTEAGGPRVKKPTRTGFGSRMIERALSASLAGVARIEFLPQGIRFELRTDRNNLNS